MRGPHLGDLLRRSLGHNRPAPVSPLGPEVYQIVGVFNDLKIMLDNQDRMAAFDQLLKGVQQLLDIGKMQPGGRLIKDEQRALVSGVFGALLGNMRGQLQALSLATGQRGQGLTQTHILQPDRGQRRQPALEFLLLAKKLQGFGNGKIQNIGQILALIANLQHLVPKTFALALGAGDVHVREKLHLDLFKALALARLAASALNIEREGTRRIATHPRQFGLRQEPPHRVKRLGIGQQVGTRRGADGRLIDKNNIGQLVAAQNSAARARDTDRLPALLFEAAIQHVFHQRRFARAGHAGQTHQPAEGNGDIDILKIMRARALDGQPLFFSDRPAFVRERNGQPAGQVLTGQGLLVFEQPGIRPVEHDLAAFFTGQGAQVDDIIGLANNLRVVLDHHDRIPVVAQVLQNTDQTLTVARMQANRRFVQNIQGVDQSGTNRRGQVHPFQLAAGQGAGLPVQGQVFHADLDQIAQAFPNLVQHELGDLLLIGGQPEGGEEFRARPDAHQVDIGQGFAPNPI